MTVNFQLTAPEATALDALRALLQVKPPAKLRARRHPGSPRRANGALAFLITSG